MTPIENRKSAIGNSPDPPESLPLSLLNDFLYCPRRAALKVVEGWRSGNQHTARGDIVHEHADLPGYEVAKGVTLLRALPVWSERLGLNGKCDIVEVHPRTRPADTLSPTGEEGRGEARGCDLSIGAQHTLSPIGGEGRGEGAAIGMLVPVEFKLGKRHQWENDDAQLCAQALCLEEMFGRAIPRGAVFHADSKRRREVDFTAELRQRTEDVARQLHALLESESVPPAEYRDACQECSLFEICLPRLTQAQAASATAAAVRRLYET